MASFYRRPLPSPPATAFSSEQGRRRFREALADGTADGAFRLLEQFRTQDEPAYCGLATLVMVLNALEVDPQNAEVKKELKRARELQKKADKAAGSMYTKMIGAGTEV